MFSIGLSTMIATASPLRLASLFSDHMVLQRDKPIAVWGWDAPRTKVKVSIGDRVGTTETNPNGYWRVMLKPIKKGEKLTLTVTGTSEKKVEDVSMGEVWICSGQSNMEWIVYNSDKRDQAKADANESIRMFTVQKTIAQSPKEDVVGSWIPAKADTVDAFSAVGYAYAVKLQKQLGCPIGMIHTSWGGTPADAWTSLGMMEKENILAPIVERARNTRLGFQNSLSKYVEAVEKYQALALPGFFKDSDSTWKSESFDDSSWQSVSMPHKFPDDFDGAFYYRKTIELSAEEANKAQTLTLGAIDDFDKTYVNGVAVGETTMTTPNFWSTPRYYHVPYGLLKPGRNIIAIKAYDNMSGGGFAGPIETIKLGNTVLDGVWKAKQGDPYVPVDSKITGPRPEMGEGPNSQNFPATLYNGMLKPLAPYGIRGAIWYQGESNAWRAFQYRTLLKTMIQDWRQIFQQGDFSFYIVQLANWQAANPKQFDSQWAELRDAQDYVGQQKNCGTATIIDIGDAADIHPRNKRDVGERLARIALKKNYGINIEWQGPRISKAAFGEKSVVLQFNHANGLTTTDKMEPRCFAVCGEDRKWEWAMAEIEGNRIILRTQVLKPIAVRYAWQDNPPVNLVNGDGLPAMPFRTDGFEPITKRNL